MHFSTRSSVVLLGLGLLAAGFLGLEVSGQELAGAASDVVVIVDTSTSMRGEGMDPERTSLLVTQLLSDLVPGELSVVRLLDLVGDADILPSAQTGEMAQCREDPNRLCGVVAPSSDWESDARAKALGVLERPTRGDEAFAKALEDHLEQRIANSMFELAFRAAQGVFERHQAAGMNLPKTVIWLSDGHSDDEPRTVLVLRELQAMGVGIEAIVFGLGETELAERAGLVARRTDGPAALMRAFAGAFRSIVGAPYEIDARIADAPSFTMQPAVEEAWVVVYGDDDLGEVRLETPAGESRPADYARRRWPGAGAYRVAYLHRPEVGKYQVRAQGGGPQVAYAVVQRSSLRPRLMGPKSAVADVETTLVAEVVAEGAAGEEGTPVSDPALLAAASLRAESDELGSVELERRDDGRFAGVVRFRRSGEARFDLVLTSPVVESRVGAAVTVSGFFRPRQAEVTVDLGRVDVGRVDVGAGEASCRALELDVDHQGEVPVLAERLHGLPSDHRLFLRVDGEADSPWQLGETRNLAPGQALEICLEVSDRAPSSTSVSRPWVRLGVEGAAEKVTLLISWEVLGLGFWARWGWLILLLLGLALLGFVIAGFITPHRFPPTLALVFVDDRRELDEQQAQPIKQWKGVRIGFYRHARAHLHTSYRVSGKARGALATLVAERGGARVLPGKGGTLARETLDGEWEAVPVEGRRVRAGDVYRIGESGPFFRLASRGGRES